MKSWIGDAFDEATELAPCAESFSKESHLHRHRIPRRCILPWSWVLPIYEVIVGVYMRAVAEWVANGDQEPCSSISWEYLLRSKSRVYYVEASNI